MSKTKEKYIEIDKQIKVLAEHRRKLEPILLLEQTGQQVGNIIKFNPYEQFSNMYHDLEGEIIGFYVNEGVVDKIYVITKGYKKKTYYIRPDQIC